MKPHSLAASWQSWLWEVNHACPFLNTVLKKEISPVATWCALYQHLSSAHLPSTHPAVTWAWGTTDGWSGFFDKMCFTFEIQVALDLQTTPQNPDTLPHTYGWTWFVSVVYLNTLDWKLLWLTCRSVMPALRQQYLSERQCRQPIVRIISDI